MLVELMHPNGVVWRRVSYDKKEDQMMLGLMYAVESEKRARQERERRAAANRVGPGTACSTKGEQQQRKTAGLRQLVTSLGFAGR
jgi:hypothetical protein